MRVNRCELGLVVRRTLGRQFGWLWTAYAVSTFGTWLAFDAFPLIAILVLHAGPTEVSVLAAAGLAVGAAVAVPLGPWVEFRRKRPVMVAMDLTRFAALMSVPAAFALGWLSFVQLLIVSVIVGAANIVFRAASGACLKALVRPEDLLVANGRFESTTWTATALGPPLGGAAIGLFGPVTPLVAVLMLGHLGFKPWQYGVAFGAPCVGGLVGSRLATRLVARFGQHKVMFTAGTLRACWSLGLAFIRPVGSAGQHHRPPHGDRDRRCPHAGHPAPATPTRLRTTARAGAGPEPHMTYPNSPCDCHCQMIHFDVKKVIGVYLTRARTGTRVQTEP
ncbi:MAG: transporter [Gammaproteobacteria bacterium]|nr:transporter [Gammaproteobacteria bacterium]